MAEKFHPKNQLKKKDSQKLYKVIYVYTIIEFEALNSCLD